MRTFFIWVFGLLGAGFLGSTLGYMMDHNGPSSAFGFFGGLTVFACLRLWLAAPKAQPPA